jgi:hypothetical protein
MGIQTDENAQKEPEKVKTTEFGAQIELEIATPIPVKPHEMGAAITQATQTPDNINELDLAPMFLAAFDFEELPAQEEELLPKLTPLKRPPKPEPFSIIGRLEDGLKQLAHDLAITCNAIGYFFAELK